MSKIHIKNMVCPRCITAVRGIFDEMKIATLSVELGEVKTDEKISSVQKKILKETLSSNGFELLTDTHSKLIEQIKTLS